MMPYCIPTCADQLFSPFLTTNNDRLLGLSRDLANIVHNLDNSFTNLDTGSVTSQQQQGFAYKAPANEPMKMPPSLNPLLLSVWKVCLCMVNAE